MTGGMQKFKCLHVILNKGNSLISDRVLPLAK